MEGETYFAPSARDPEDLLALESSAVASAQIGQNVLDAIPDLAMILNERRQIVAVNTACMSALGVDSAQCLVGQRPGEAIHCIHASQGPSGCGTSVACRQCGAVRSILNCLNTHQMAQYECRITAVTTDAETAMDFLAKASFVQIGSYPLVLLVLRDISADKRKEALERLFFHDVLNTVGGMIGLTDMMASDTSPDSNHYLHLVHHLAENVAEEITAHRNLVLAEKGSLAVDPSNVNLSDLFMEIADGLAYHPISRGISIETEVASDCSVRTDRVLIRRVVSNLVKNALEASASGDVVRMMAKVTQDGVVINVHNPTFMPERVQSQMFKRSFSTKGDVGRGLGTYSIKLFTERYLSGHVTFDSSEESGTTFSVELRSLATD